MGFYFNLIKLIQLLIDAAANGRVDECQRLIDDGADVNYCDSVSI